MGDYSGNIRVKNRLFGPNLFKKEYFQSIKEKANTTMELNIFDLFLVPNFSLSKLLWIFELDFPKKGNSYLKKKREHHYQIQYIQVSYGTKVHLKQILLNFWTKFAQKG